VETTIADKSLLVDFKVKRFTRFLSDLKLLQPEWDVLAYLASEQVVPLAAIAASLGRDAGDVAQVVRKLIDNSLVIVADDNLAISPPIRDAITRARGHISAENYSKILERLTQAFWSGESVAPSIEVVDATLHAVARSGSKDFDPYNDLVRVSIVHRLARESYHRRDYDDAFEYARRADRMGARHFDVLAIMFKALVKLERWGDAEQMLARIKATGNRQYWFLKGFLHRRRREYDQARLAYEQAFEAGDNGFALHRDYADVLHRLGRLSDATEQIRNLLARGTENVFVLDLALRIYADSLKRNEDVGMTAEEVEKYLHELDRFDIDRRFINHRRATILAAQGQIVDAIEYADAACISDPQSFEAFSLRVGLLVEAGRLRDAESALQELNARFKIGQDVQLGLAIKLECSRGDWRRALAIWNRLHDRERPVHQVLLLGIKRLQAADKDLSLAERNSADAKASEIRERLDSIDEGLGPEYDED
jgi:tetratricopeptide (TPR) repeat protein